MNDGRPVSRMFDIYGDTIPACSGLVERSRAVIKRPQRWAKGTAG